MSGESLAATLSRLNSCQDAAEIIYSQDAAQRLTDPAASSLTAANRDELSLIIARRIGTMVARLNDLSSPSSQVVFTPRMVLCELMDIVRQALFTSLPPPMQTEVSPTDKTGVVRLFNVYASTRQIPLEAAVEGLYTVSYVSVKLRIELVALQLRRRIQEELRKKDTHASEGSVAALVVTETLLEDFMIIYNNIVLTLPITKAASGVNAADGAAALAAERLVPVFLQYFYQLCDWVLVLESTMKGAVMSYTQVKRLSVDEQRGTVVVDLHRPTPQTAWGLLLNEQGCLVDIDVSLRVFEKAKQLHRLLQATLQGAQITKINDHVIPPVRQGNYAAHAQRVVEVLQSVTATRKNVQLTLQSSAFKAAARTLPTEVAFVAPPQGGEGTSGQRVTLVLRRQSTGAEWGFTVDERLYWHHPPARILSEAAKAFVRDYGKHLRLLAVNGVEALHPQQVVLLTEAAETVVLELLVMPFYADGKRAASRGGVTASAASKGVAHSSQSSSSLAGERPATGTAAKAPKVTRGSADGVDDAKMEAAVAKFLQSHSDGSAAASAAAGSAEVEPVVAMETPLVDAVMETPSPAAAAGQAAVAETEAKRKRGRPRKSAVVSEAPTDGSIDLADKAVQDILAAFANEKPKGKKAASANAATVVAGPAADTEAEGGSTTEAEAACVFDNKVQLLHLTDAEMVLERPSTDMPWGLPIGRIADTSEAPQKLPLRLMSLPPAKAAAVRAHPFLAEFKKEPTTWFIAEVNGKPASNAETTLKAIAKLTRMTLRFLRK